MPKVFSLEPETMKPSKPHHHTGYERHRSNSVPTQAIAAHWNPHGAAEPAQRDGRARASEGPAGVMKPLRGKNEPLAEQREPAGAEEGSWGRKGESLGPFVEQEHFRGGFP